MILTLILAAAAVGVAIYRRRHPRPTIREAWQAGRERGER